MVWFLRSAPQQARSDEDTAMERRWALSDMPHHHSNASNEPKATIGRIESISYGIVPLSAIHWLAHAHV